MAIVNLRIGGPEDDVAAPMRTMRRMQEEGLIAHIGISTVDAAQLAVARDIAPVVCVQNHYNLVHRGDDAMIDALAEAGIAYVPYFPLGGFTPLQSDGADAGGRRGRRDAAGGRAGLAAAAQQPGEPRQWPARQARYRATAMWRL